MKRKLLFLLTGILLMLSLISCELKIPDIKSDDSSSDESSAFDDSSGNDTSSDEDASSDESSIDDSSSMPNEDESSSVSGDEDEDGNGDNDGDSTHTVIFDYNNGSSNVITTVEHGEKLSKPTDPEIIGYTFDGWYIDDEKWGFAGYTVTDDITLVAKWTPTVYEIEGYPYKDSYTIEDEFTLTADKKDGYFFGGYYLNGEKITKIETGTVGDLVFESRFTPIKYTITYVDSLNAENTNEITFSVEKPVTLSNLSYSGYSFDGWFVNGSKATVISTDLFGFNDVTVTAKWTLNTQKWAGKTLTVLATNYSQTGGAPWGQLELNPESFGTSLNTAFENRQAFIFEQYGVTVKWLAS